MQIDFQLDDEYAKKLEYIREQTEIDLLQHIKSFIDTRYRQLQPPVGDPLAKLKNSPFIGSFQGPPDLAKNSKAFLHATMGGGAEVVTLKPGKSLVVITESPEVDINEFENKDEVKNKYEKSQKPGF